MNHTDNQYKLNFRAGGLFSIPVFQGIVAGNITGGDINSLPQTAIARFQELHMNCLLGLYNLDLLNSINHILLIPFYFALFMALMENNRMALLSLFVFLMGPVLNLISENRDLAIMNYLPQ